MNYPIDEFVEVIHHLIDDSEYSQYSESTAFLKELQYYSINTKQQPTVSIN